MKHKLFTTFVIVFIYLANLFSQLPPVFETRVARIRTPELTRVYLPPTRIIWISDTTGKLVQNASAIIKPGNGQADMHTDKYLKLVSTINAFPGIILDFGKEIQGGLEIITTKNNSKPAGRLRIRFGESVQEAMSEAGSQGSTNDHAMRDFVITVPWLGRLEVGNSGFRFVRLDIVDSETEIEIKEINAIFVFREIPYVGSFQCNDERLNQIWLTGAYTVHLNMQEYLWDGIKRDRLVWIGDMHPEVMTINTVFGFNEVVPKSLDLVRDITPLPSWMNGISSYSMWWILIQRDWYTYHGDLDYLKKQKNYLTALLKELASNIDDSGSEILKGRRFLDWPTSENKEAIHAGLQALMVLAFQAGAELCKVLDEPASVTLCNSSIEKLKRHIPEMAGSKQAAALLSLSGLISADKANQEVLSKDGVHKMSTFYGYYMLKARALAGDYQGALDNIRQYWGAMLDLGATTFWEDFDIDWMKNAARIDEVVPSGKVDVHGSYGNYCYRGFRHSFCHGWASGPTPWLTQYILGVNVIEPGCKVIKLIPHLCDLEWVTGTFPTPYGILRIQHKKGKGNKIETTYVAPKEVKVILENK